MPHHYDVTFHGLHKWHTHMFEKLGWMVLAKQHGYKDKIDCYLNGCERLKEALAQKLQEYEEKDRKMDIEVLHHNADTLCDVARKLLKGDCIKMRKMSGSSSSSKKTLKSHVMKGGFFDVKKKTMKGGFFAATHTTKPHPTRKH